MAPSSPSTTRKTRGTLSTSGIPITDGPKTPAVPDNEEDDGVGLSDTRHSQSSRILLDLVNKLHDTGVQSEIDLPQIAVIGSQSAGKSSLIESISGITLPRAAGTCTRCPTECRLSYSPDPWQCKVSLHRVTDNAGKLLPHSQDIPFGPVITNKAHVQERIRRAQRAILSPKRSFQDFLNFPENQLGSSELSFSKNWVSLDISGPDIADLSFVDLPGLIASVGTGGNNDDIHMVKELVSSYTKKDSCVILLTVTCETDFENQGAYDLARQHDPQGRRTVGVLTKPDRIPAREEDRWLSLLRNDREPLVNGWFCVKQPSTQDLERGVSWKQARKAEDTFFSTNVPWSTLDDFSRSHLATTKLVSTLSSILSGLIKARLPGIQRDVDRKLQLTKKNLRSLGVPPSKDPQNEIMNMLYAFHRDLASCVQGEPGADGLLQRIRPIQDAFRETIYKTAPNFCPFERKYGTKRKLEQADFLRNEEGGKGNEESDDDEDSEEGVEKQGVAFPVAKRRRIGGEGEVIFIDDVMNVAKRARTRELPGSYPFYVQQQYIRDITQQWEAPAQKLCDDVYKALLDYMEALVRNKFGSYGQGILEQRVGMLLRKHIQQAKEESEKKIVWLLRLETQPFTLNQHYLLDYNDKFKTFYTGSRAKDHNPAFVQALRNHKQSSTAIPSPSTPQRTKPSQYTQVASSAVSATTSSITQALAALAETGLEGIKAQDLSRLLPLDEMAPALNIMADVRAYFQVAFKRYADNIPLAVDLELVTGVERDFLSIMLKELGLSGPNAQSVCQDLARESTQVANRRAELENRLRVLEKASEELLDVGLRLR